MLMKEKTPFDFERFKQEAMEMQYDNFRKLANEP